MFGIPEGPNFCGAHPTKIPTRSHGTRAMLTVPAESDRSSWTLRVCGFRGDHRCKITDRPSVGEIRLGANVAREANPPSGPAVLPEMDCARGAGASSGGLSSTLPGARGRVL